jgi:hypothetical protein
VNSCDPAVNRSGQRGGLRASAVILWLMSTEYHGRTMAHSPLLNDHNVYILGAGFSADAGIDLLAGRAERAPLGCTILRSAQFWPQGRWIAWGEAEGWARNIVQGKTEMDAARAVRLLSEMQASDQLIPDLDESPFEPLANDERVVEARDIAVREGQGAFRAGLLDAYTLRARLGHEDVHGDSADASRRARTPAPSARGRALLDPEEAHL